MVMGNIIPTKEHLIRRHQQYCNDPVINDYYNQMARIHMIAPIDHAEVGSETFRFFYSDIYEKEIERLNRELNEYIRLNYSDVLENVSHDHSTRTSPR